MAASLALLLALAAGHAVASGGLRFQLPWRIQDETQRRPRPTRMGAAIEGGGIFRRGDETGGFAVYANGVLIHRNTLVLEPFVGYNVLKPPPTPSDPPDYGTSDHDVHRLSYGGSLLVQPLAATSETSKRWTFLFCGVRLLWNKRSGTMQEALDCLYCSNVTETYTKTLNAFASIGVYRPPIYIRLDLRLTDEEGYFSVDAYDPWHVGPSYSYTRGPYHEPQLVLLIGYRWMVLPMK